MDKVLQQKTQSLIFGVLFFFLIFLFGTNAFSADKWVQPLSPNGMDTWFGDTYNTSAQFDARDRIGGWNDYYYTYLRFNLSGLPLVATQAVIWRWTINDGGTSTPVDWYSVGSQWQKNTISMYNFPNLYSYLGYTSAPALGWEGTIITGLYNQWRAGANPQNFGLLLAPINNWNNWSSIASSRDTAGHGPVLQVTYTPQANDNVIKLKWPLPDAYSRGNITTAWKANWVSSCGGRVKLHNGIDYHAAAGTPVSASEDGIVKNIYYSGDTVGFASVVVIEHNSLVPQ